MDDRERGREIAEQRTGFFPGNLTELAQIAAGQKLHRVVGAFFVAPVVVDFDDAGMSELAQRVVLALEELGEGFALEPVGEDQALQRELATVAQVAHAVHRAHPALAQQLYELVAARDDLVGHDLSV